MIKFLITDLSRVLLFPKDSRYSGSLNQLYKNNVSTNNFNFFDFFEVNEELLTFYKSLSDDLTLSILTSDTIQDAPELKPYFDEVFSNVFSAKQMGLHKSEKDIYEEVISNLDANADEVIYIDDSTKNIDAANEAGLNTILHTTNIKTVVEVNEYLDVKLE